MEKSGQVARYSLFDGYLFHDVFLCTPAGSLRHLIMHESHNCEHFGTNKTLAMVRSPFFWLSMDRDVAYYVKRCIVCQRSKETSTNVSTCTPFPIPTGH